MSKKDKKKFDAEGQAPEAPATTESTAPEAAPKAPAIPKVPSLYLQMGEKIGRAHV